MKQRLLLCLAIFLLGIGHVIAQDAKGVYHITDQSDAEAEAKRLNVPVAWFATFPDLIVKADPEPDSHADITQMALRYLQREARHERLVVIIFFADKEFNQVPNEVYDQFQQEDDGPLKGGGKYICPKVVFTTADAKGLWGRASFTKMKQLRDDPLDELLDNANGRVHTYQPTEAPKEAGSWTSSEPTRASSSVKQDDTTGILGAFGVGIVIALVLSLRLLRIMRMFK